MEEKKISKFSSGLNIITRLDFLWKNCQELKRRGNYMGWNDELDTIWLELARDLEIDKFNDSKKQDGSKIYGVKSEFNKFDIKLIEQLPFNDSFIGFKSPEKNIMIKRNKQYKILMDKQLFLARLENSLNKGTSWEEEDDDF